MISSKEQLLKEVQEMDESRAQQVLARIREAPHAELAEVSSAGAPATHSPQQNPFTEFLERTDRLKGPVADLLKALAKRVEGAPRHTLAHTLALVVFILFLLVGAGALVWFDKVGSDVLTLLVGFLMGLLSNYMRAIFPPKD